MERRNLTDIEGLTHIQVEEFRSFLHNFMILPDRRDPDIDYDVLPEFVNLLFFGPSGSGKSSLIKSIHRALHNTASLPPQIAQKIVVKGTAHNEGTTLFASVTLKQPRPSSSGIKLHDSRGQIWMDPREQAQAALLIDGQVKDQSRVEQRNYRYAYMLWEFWKRQQSLFPSDILNRRPTLAEKPHCLLFVFDGSMDDIPNGQEETEFYRQILSMARNKGFFYPLVVLTRYDQIEAEARSESLLKQTCEMKIERAVMNLGVPRSNVHFIENYREGRPQTDKIDYQLLRLLNECVQHSEVFLESHLRTKSSCAVQQ